MAQFGTEFRKRYFSHIPDDLIPVNHGSRGLTPKPVLEYFDEMNKEHVLDPDEFYLIRAKDRYVNQLKSLSEFLKVDYRNLILITHVTMAVNCVLRSIPWDFEKDKILIHFSTYHDCAYSVDFLHDRFNFQFDVIDILYLMEDDEIVQKFETKLSHTKYKLYMFDTVCSMPGVRLPYKELIKICKKYDTWSLIDGAHGVGLENMDFISEFKPDFITFNLHKWFSTSKSCAFIYVDSKHHRLMQTFPISWTYSLNSTKNNKEIEENILIEKFWYVGTINYSAAFCIEKAIEFRKNICGDEENIHEYQKELEKKAIDIVLGEFGPGAKFLDNNTHTLNCIGIFNISFPKNEKNTKFIENLSESYDDYRKFKFRCETRMIKEDKTFAPFIAHNNELWVRFSVNIYNVASDYEKSAKLVKRMIDKCIEEELE